MDSVRPSEKSIRVNCAAVAMKHRVNTGLVQLSGASIGFSETLVLSQ